MARMDRSRLLLVASLAAALALGTSCSDSADKTAGGTGAVPANGGTSSGGGGAGGSMAYSGTQNDLSSNCDGVWAFGTCLF